MMRIGRIGAVSLLACGALGVAGAAVVQAAGETVTSTAKVSPSKVKIGPSGKPVPVKISFTTKIAGAAGARETPLKLVDVKFPKGIVMDATKFQICPVSALEANKPETCPPRSVIGHHQAVVNATPLFKDVLTTDGPIYATGRTKTGITWASYQTSTTIKTLHGVLPGTMKLVNGVVKLHSDAPVLHTAPGLPDGSNLAFDFQFDARGSDTRTLLRAKKACSGGWALPITFTFTDASASTSTAKAAC
jgi:hypothetical protein